jgi:hypothetical protein
MKDVEKLIHAHCVKNKYTTTDEHCFCKNLVDHLVDCVRKEYQVKSEATSKKFVAPVVEKFDSCKHSVKLRSMTID